MTETTEQTTTDLRRRIYDAARETPAIRTLRLRTSNQAERESP